MRAVVGRKIEPLAGHDFGKALAAVAQAGKALRACGLLQAEQGEAGCEGPAGDGRSSAQW